MGFFKDLREDISQAVNELLPDETFWGLEEGEMAGIEGKEDAEDAEDNSGEEAEAIPEEKVDSNDEFAFEREEIQAEFDKNMSEPREETEEGKKEEKSVDPLEDLGLGEIAEEINTDFTETETTMENEDKSDVEDEEIEDLPRAFMEAKNILDQISHEREEHENEEISTSDIEENVEGVDISLPIEEMQEDTGVSFLEEETEENTEEEVEEEAEEEAEASLSEEEVAEEEEALLPEEEVAEEEEVSLLEEEVAEEEEALLPEEEVIEEPEVSLFTEETVEDTEAVGSDDVITDEMGSLLSSEENMQDVDMFDDLEAEKEENQIADLTDLFSEENNEDVTQEKLDDTDVSEKENPLEEVSFDETTEQIEVSQEETEEPAIEPEVSMEEELDTSMKEIDEAVSMEVAEENVLEALAAIESADEDITDKEVTIIENIEEKEVDTMSSQLNSAEAKDEVTVITKGTIINGSISSDGSLEVNGTITGDVECLGKLVINGNVSGHLKADEVVVSTPKLDGGIDSNGDVKIGVGTIVLGDVSAKSATVSGAVRGEIDVNGPVVVDSTAIVKGNITAKSVQINNGAVVDGYCKLTYAEVDIDNFFDEN